MSQSIVQEVDFLVHAGLLGISITFLYDSVRVIRRVIKHGNVLIAVEDFVFWMICSYLIFDMLMRENSGALRWFAIGGSLLGMIVFKGTLSHFYVKYGAFILNKTIEIIMKLLFLILRPICFIMKKTYLSLRKIWRICKKNGQIIRNRLTKRVKMVKIMLCKQHSKGE